MTHSHCEIPVYLEWDLVLPDSSSEPHTKPTCKATQTVGLALWSCDHAVLTWPMQRKVCNGLEIFVPQTEQGLPSWQVVHEWALWEVVPHKALPPSLVRSKLGAVVAPHGVVLARSARDEPLLQHSVRKGLQGCTSGTLAKVLKTLGFAPKDIPKTVLEKMVAIIRSVFPRMSSAHIAEILKARVGLQSVPKRASSLTSYNMECTDGVIDATEQSDAKKDLFEEEATSLAQVQTMEFIVAAKLGSEVVRKGRGGLGVYRKSATRHTSSVYPLRNRELQVRSVGFG